nr:hypothetical protein [Angustibacter aerolatus]
MSDALRHRARPLSVDGLSVAPAPAARVVVLAGPSGSGKSHLAARLGLPVLRLDDFYRDGDDPALPRAFGIVDWDDPASWDRDRAVATMVRLCTDGAADVPEYDIPTSRVTGHGRLEPAGRTAGRRRGHLRRRGGAGPQRGRGARRRAVPDPPARGDVRPPAGPRPARAPQAAAHPRAPRAGPAARRAARRRPAGLARRRPLHAARGARPHPGPRRGLSGRTLLPASAAASAARAVATRDALHERVDQRQRQERAR